MDGITMAKKHPEFHDLSIFNVAKPHIAQEEEKPITTLKYVPSASIQTLLSRGKSAMKTEVSLLKERAEIEMKYARSLREWSKKYSTKLKSGRFYEYGEIKDAVEAILEEGLRAADCHAQMSGTYFGINGAVANLQNFLDEGVSSSVSHLKLSGDSLGGRFERSLEEYTDALHECLHDIRKAMKSKTQEAELKEVIKRKEDLLNASESPKSSKKKSLHNVIEGDIVTTKLKLASVEGKRKNRYCKARHTLREREHYINAMVSSIMSWETDRVKLVCRNLADVLNLFNQKINVKVWCTYNNVNVLRLVEKITSAEYAAEQVSRWERGNTYLFIPVNQRHHFHIAAASQDENQPVTEVQASLDTSARTEPLQTTSCHPSQAAVKPGIVTQNDWRPTKGKLAFLGKEIWNPKGSGGCTKSENDLEELKRSRHAGSPQKQGSCSPKQAKCSSNESTNNTILPTTTSSSSKIQDGGDNQKPSPKPHLSHYGHFRNYVGKVIFAAFDIDGTGKYSNYKEGGLRARQGQAIILRKFIAERNLGFGCVKTGSIISKRKYGYFHLSQVTTVKPM